MAHSDWIPSREQGLVDLSAKWTAGLVDPATQTAFGWDTAEYTATVQKITAFVTASSTYETDNSTKNRIAKDEAKVEEGDAMRDFANSSIRFNKKITNEDKLVYGIRPVDTTQTSHAKPESQPDTDVLPTLNHYEHRVNALNHALGDTSKPADAYGVRYAWQVGGEKPASGEDLPKTVFSRRTHHIVTHTEADRGKRFTMRPVTKMPKVKSDRGVR
jgi:hypothetical protein